MVKNGHQAGNCLSVLVFPCPPSSPEECEQQKWNCCYGKETRAFSGKCLRGLYLPDNRAKQILDRAQLAAILMLTLLLAGILAVVFLIRPP